MQTFHLDDFAGGRDIRPGTFSGKDKNRFSVLTNFTTTRGKKLRRRPPMKAHATAFSANVKSGLAELDGNLFAFVKRGETVSTNPVTSAYIARFDVPPFAQNTAIVGSDWKVLDAIVFNGVVCALIRHGLATSTATNWTSGVALHVFDHAGFFNPDVPTGNDVLSYSPNPSYVADPWCPTNFKTRWPFNVYGTSTQKYTNDWSTTWEPRLSIGAGKLWIMGCDGNPYCSGVANARVWNEEEASDLNAQGTWIYAPVPSAGLSASTEESVLLPVPCLDLWREGSYSSYVIEGLAGVGGYATWNRFKELTDQVSLTGGPTWRARIEPAAAPWAEASATSVYTQSLTGNGAATVFDFTSISYATWTGGGYERIVMVSGLPSMTFTASDNAGTLRITFLDVPANNSKPTVWMVRTGAAHQTKLYFTRDENVNGVKTDMVIRLRALTGAPPVSIVSGGLWTDSQNRAAGVVTFEGVTKTCNAIVAVAAPPAAGPYAASMHYGTAWAGGGAVGGYGIYFGDGSEYTRNAAQTPRFGRYLAATTLCENRRFLGPAMSGFDRYVHLFTSVHSWDTATSAFGTYNPLAANVIAHGTIQGYGYETSRESAFYIAAKATFLTLAGFGAAGFLNTTAHEKDGRILRGMGAVKNRLALFYDESLQLWSINADITQDVLLDKGATGLGSRVSPVTNFYNDLIALSIRGIRAYSVIGNNSDSAEDTNIGESIEEFQAFTLISAGYWPYMGIYVAVLKNATTAAVEVHALSHSRESKITAWSKWTIASFPEPTSQLIAIGPKLYWRTATGLYYFDAEHASFKDSTDGATAYESRAETHPSHFARPGQAKQFHRFDLAFTGAWTVSFNLITRGVVNAVTGFPLSAITYGGEGVGLCMAGDALGVVLVSTAETAVEVESIAVDFDYKRR